MFVSNYDCHLLNLEAILKSSHVSQDATLASRAPRLTDMNNLGMKESSM